MRKCHDFLAINLIAACNLYRLGKIMPFSEDFLWGVSTSGFQFEMGDPDGKNIDPNTDWYVWAHDPSNIRKGIVSGDLPERGINYWNLYKQDHATAKSLGLNAYRIGIEWSRIFPESTSGIEVGVERASDGNIAKIDVDESALENLEKVADRAAVSHYRDVIEDLRISDFQVFVCLNHFTLPLWIHDPMIVRKTHTLRGPKGWVDENTIVEFTKYAAYMAWKLGDIVDNWTTFNEPGIIAETGYMIPQSGFPPGLKFYFRVSRKVALHLVIAHARAYDAVKKIDTIKADEKSGCAANVGLIHNVIPVRPFSSTSKLDAKTAEFMDNMHNQFFVQSICDGWLDENLNGVKEKGEMKNYLGQRLDWLGVNYYTRFVVKGKASALSKTFAGIPVIPEIVQDYGFACQPAAKSADGLPTSDSGWEIYPEGLLDALNAMKKYEKPLYVTENGVADGRDALRPSFITEHLRVLERAVNEEKLDVRGYFHWSLTDNYEWAKGFGSKFGLYAVDMDTKSRKSRMSAETYKEIVKAEK
jgi:beta-galactosidase